MLNCILYYVEILIQYLVKFKKVLYCEFEIQLGFVLKESNSALKASVLDVRTCQKVKSIISNNLYSDIWENVVDNYFIASSQNILSKIIFFRIM
jgi:hypothetical protein